MENLGFPYMGANSRPLRLTINISLMPCFDALAHVGTMDQSFSGERGSLTL